MARRLAQTPFAPEFHIIDSIPLIACRFARAYRCQRFKGDAAFGYDPLTRQAVYGFRLRAPVPWHSVIAGFSAAAAIAPELTLGPTPG